MSRNWLGPAIVACALALTGCASSNLAFGIAPEDPVGTWVAAENFGTVLTLGEDGDLAASGWPAPLGCDGHAVEDIASLREAEKVEISGGWSAGELRPHHLNLSFDKASCLRRGITGDVWRRGDDGELAICIPIRVGVDPDSLGSEQWFVLVKDSSESATAPFSC